MKHWFFHTWTKWQTITSDSFTRSWLWSPESSAGMGWFEKQKRECNVCGKSELRTVETEL